MRRLVRRSPRRPVASFQESFTFIAYVTLCTVPNSPVIRSATIEVNRFHSRVIKCVSFRVLGLRDRERRENLEDEPLIRTRNVCRGCYYVYFNIGYLRTPMGGAFILRISFHFAFRGLEILSCRGPSECKILYTLTIKKGYF